LRHLQVSLGAQISYRKAADLLRMLLPPMGGTTHTTTRSRVIAVGERIDEEIRRSIVENRKPDKPAKQMIIGIDGAFVKGRPPTDQAQDIWEKALGPDHPKVATYLEKLATLLLSMGRPEEAESLQDPARVIWAKSA